MRVLVVYGTTEGHTRKIATAVVRQLRAQGHEATGADAAQLPPELDVVSFDGVIVAARVHAGRYPRSVLRFVRRHRGVLAARPSAFISVSMAAACHRPGDAQRVHDYVDYFMHSSGWLPGLVHHAAGARLYARRGALGRFVLGLVDGHRYDPTRDHEFTDWAGLASFVREWAGAAASRVVRQHSYV
jgi:menaquinone-dependent protoporphyrinogen oxidase